MIQYESAKYLLTIPIILIKIKNNFNQNFIKTIVSNFYTLTQ